MKLELNLNFERKQKKKTALKIDFFILKNIFFMIYTN